MKILKQRQGVAIILVLTYFLTLVIILSALFMLSMSNFNNQNTSIDHSESYYAAESCLNFAVEDFKTVIDSQLANSASPTEFYSAIDLIAQEIDGSSTSSEIDAFSHPLNSVECSLSVNILGEVGSGHEYEIIANGSSDDVDRSLSKIVSLTYTKDGEDPFSSEYAMLVKNSISLIQNGQGSSITSTDATALPANIATYSTIPNAIDLGTKLVLDGIETVLPSAEFPGITFDEVDNQAALYKSKVFNGYNLASGEYVLDGSLGKYGYAETITWVGDLTINVTKDTFLMTKKLTLGGIVNIIGPGVLTIYVQDPRNVQLADNPYPLTNNDGLVFSGNNSLIGRYSIVPADPKNLMIFVRTWLINGSPATLYISNGTRFTGSLMLENANISVENNSYVNGYVVTGGTSVTVGNNADSTTKGFYFVPNGTVNLINNAVFTGAIVSDSITIANGVTFKYAPMSPGDMPFVLTNPVTGGLYGGNPTLNYDFSASQEID